MRKQWPYCRKFSSIFKINKNFPAETNRTVEIMVFKKIKSIFFCSQKEKKSQLRQAKKQHGVDDFFPFSTAEKNDVQSKGNVNKILKKV